MSQDGTPPSTRVARLATAGKRGAADRVRRSHAQTRTTLQFALAFIGAAAIAVPLADSRWLPLHLFLAGGVTLAISAVSLMLAVTWSAAPAPAPAAVFVQRALVGTGAAGVAIGRESDLAAGLVGAAGVAYLGGLWTLAGLLATTISRGVERRFDAAVAAYLVAIVAGTAGAVLGVIMVTDAPSVAMRDAHTTANLLGLVGIVIAGTMPYFASTVGRARMSRLARPRNVALVVGGMGVSLGVAIVALVRDATAVAVVGLGGYAAGIGGALWLLPRPTRRQVRWAGPRLIALWAGAGWWAVAVVASAVDVAISDRLVFGGRWALVLVLGGYAQILWGSLAYLLPMLRGGGHERLSEGFAATRSWLGLVAANVAALSVAVALPSEIAAAAVTAWMLDGAWRAVRVGAGRASRPSGSVNTIESNNNGET